METAGAPDPLQLRPHGLNFKDLQHLSEYLDRITEDADATFEHFQDPGLGGFQHRVERGAEATKSSKASTATCFAYLSASGNLDDSVSDEQLKVLREEMVKGDWTSAELDEDNVFTVPFILETLLVTGKEDGLEPESRKIVEEKIALMNQELVDRDGGLLIEEYPPTAFLTHKVVRVLKEWGALTDDAEQAAWSWTWNRVYEESMLIDAEGPDADYFELAYAALAASLTSPWDTMTPRQRRLLQHAIEQFFTGQRDDGTWPRSRPLFNYPDIGYAFCFDYELLVQLLSDRRMTPWLLPHLADLRRAAWALDQRKIPLGEKDGERRTAWSSEHHGRKSSAESWSTACVYHFCFELRRLVAGAARREVFEYVDATYEEPTEEAPVKEDPLADYLDSQVKPKEGDPFSFKKAFGEYFLDPLIEQRADVGKGRPFKKGTKASAIMYGPPGTSKTMLADLIAKALGWPLLALDPSHLTREGLDNVHAEANAVFGRLELCDQVVVLLDEFDELVREREDTGDLTSRFLTTAMLPKIAALHERRRIVYLVATNHVEVFDAAISRRGRFDVIVPVMPPTAEAKLDSEIFKPLSQACETLDQKDRPAFKAAIDGLTFDEARDLQGKIARQPEKVLELAGAAAENATLRKRVAAKKDEEGDQRWEQRVLESAEDIRGLDGS